MVPDSIIFDRMAVVGRLTAVGVGRMSSSQQALQPGVPDSDWVALEVFGKDDFHSMLGTTAHVQVSKLHK